MESKWNVRTIYLYLICLITLVMIIFATGDLVREATQVILPPPMSPGKVRTLPPMGKEGPGDFDPAAFEAQREWERQNQRYHAIRGIAGDIAMLALAVPIYLYHWRKVQNEKTG